MVKKPGFNYSQTYIEHGYLELCIEKGKDGEVSSVHFTSLASCSISI